MERVRSHAKLGIWRIAAVLRPDRDFVHVIIVPQDVAHRNQHTLRTASPTNVGRPRYTHSWLGGRMPVVMNASTPGLWLGWLSPLMAINYTLRGRMSNRVGRQVIVMPA